MRGRLFAGRFDISAEVKAGKTAVVAVLVTPQPDPGVPHEHTLRRDGVNGGITAIDGPTFFRRLDGIGFRRFGSGYRDLAEGFSFGYRTGGGEGPAGDDGSAVAGTIRLMWGCRRRWRM